MYTMCMIVGLHTVGPQHVPYRQTTFRIVRCFFIRNHHVWHNELLCRKSVDSNSYTAQIYSN